MDALDVALLTAWSRLAPTLRVNRAEALRRATRLAAATFRRPVRPWCCCIGSSDTRFATLARISPARALATNAPHTLRLTAENLRVLCAPIHLNWPGIRWTLAANQLGCHCESLRAWIDRRAFNVRYVAPATVGSHGKSVPFLWSASPIGPNAELGKCPDAAWGSMWLGVHEQIPDTANLTVQRTPHFTPYTRRDGTLEHRFRGWRFRCPGLTKPCNRLVTRLYLPIPVWTIHHANATTLTRDVQSGDSPPDSQWACHHCHRVKYISFITANGWNEYISYLTSGLLFGREVQKPKDFTPKRKRKYVPHRPPLRAWQGPGERLKEPAKSERL